MNISNKYLAGFLDSDGSIGLQFRKLKTGQFTVQARVSFKQRSDRSIVIRQVAEDWDVSVHHEDKWSGSDLVVLTCNKAVRLLEQIKNHLVIKYDLARFALEVNGMVVDEPNELRNLFDTLRKLRCSREKTFPSSQWLAGYFDGDGCVTINKDHKVLMRFTSWINDPEGVELIKKQFGGSLYREKNCLRLDVYKSQKLIEYFHDNCVIKKAQLQYVLENLRKGSVTEEVKANLSKMKVPASTKRMDNPRG